MKKSKILALITTGCFVFQLPSCIDQQGLADLGGDLLCQIATSGLPFATNVDYCSVINIDLPAGTITDDDNP